MVKHETTQAEPTTAYPWYFSYFPPSLLAIITFLSYYPSLSYPFQFDDLANIAKKFDIRFYRPFSLYSLCKPRWMSEYLNRLNYQMSKWWCGNGFDPIIYRFCNLLIHITAGLILFALIQKLLTCRSDKKSFLHRHAYLISFITAGLFLLHPAQTQAVSYVIQARLECLATLCMFLALLCLGYLAQANTTGSYLVWLNMLLVTTLIACGTKEIAIVTPLLIVLSDWFFVSQQQWSQFKKRAFIYIGLIAAILGIFWYYNSLSWFTNILLLKTSTTNNRGNILTTLPNELITPIRFCISEFKVIIHYLLMYVWPFDLSVEYDWKLSSSIFAPDAFFPFLLLIAIGAYIMRNIKTKQHPQVTYGLLWFFITIAPRSSIIPSSELICDYKAYPASAGWLLIISVLIVKAIERLTDELKKQASLSPLSLAFMGFMVVLSLTYTGIIAYEISQTPASYKSFVSIALCIPIAIIAMLYYVITHRKKPQLYQKEWKSLFCAIFFIGIGYSSLVRNTVWRSAREFWGDIIAKAPLKARAYNNYGVAISEEGAYKEAISAYQKAIELDAYYADPHSNLAVAYSMEGNIDDAIVCLQNAIRITPHYPEAYNNLGTLLLQKKEYTQAAQAFNTALSMRPYYGKALFNLARLHLEQDDQEQAWTYLKKATEGDLDNEIGFTTLGQMSLQLKKYEDALQAFTQAISIAGEKETLLFNLANAAFMCKKYEYALGVYAKLTTLNPHHSGYWYNQGETLYTIGRYDQALRCFSSASQCTQPLAQAHLRIANTLEKQGRIADASRYLHELLTCDAPDEFKHIVQSELGRIEQTKTNVATADGLKAPGVQACAQEYT